MGAAARALARTGLRSVVGAALRWSGVLCLNYHRIGEPGRSQLDHELWSASVDAFDRQVGFLTKHFDVVTPADLPDALVRSRSRFVLLTFDDGYLDNYTDAFPILKRHGVAATFFVTTGFIDERQLPWWDEIAWMIRSSHRTGLPAHDLLPGGLVFDDPRRDGVIETLLRAYKSLPGDATQPFLRWIAEASGSGRHHAETEAPLWMTWDMLREMRDAGMVIGGHTVTHPVLANLPPGRQWEEISGCADRIAAEMGDPMRYFSYPVGQPDSFDQHSRACLARLGIRFAFSYYGGYQRFEEWDSYDIRRVAVERYMDLDWVSALATLPGIFGAPR